MLFDPENSAKRPGLVMFSRKDASRYVNMAVLDRNRKTLTWFTCHGSAYDSAQLLDIEYNHIISKTLDPFDFYKDFCLENLSYLENAESQFRQLGNAALKDTFHNRQVVYSSLPVKSATSTLQKVMAIESLIKKQCLQLYLFDSRSPAHLLRNDSFLLRKSLAGKVVRKGDTTTYHNTYLFGSAAKIVLYKQEPQKMFVYNGQGHLIDSVPLKPEKYATLVKAKEDVFLLYRGWLELQSQQVLDVTQQVEGLLNRQDTSLYTQTYRLENKRQLQLAMFQLKEQQNVVEHKISGLIVPDQQMVEYMLKDAYQDAPSEISYLPGLGFAYSISYIRGQKVYELTDHRENVMAVVSDRRKAVDENGDGVVEYYNPDVVNAVDYMPFGGQMVGRTYSGDDKYRYGFNGKENDNEVKGEGNQQDYGMRIYDPRIARFLSVDPITAKYPELTPYQFASNRPIDGIDLDGLEYVKKIPKIDYVGEWYDYISAVDNAGIDLLNLAPELWNSGVANYQSARRGTYFKDLGGELNAVGKGLKQTGIQLWTQPLQTLSSPQSIEFLVSLYIGSKVALPTSAKGSLLSPVKTYPNMALGLDAIEIDGKFTRILRKFSSETLSFDHKSWQAVYGDVATGNTFGEIFSKVANHVVDNGGVIKFNVTGMDFKQVATDIGKGLQDASSYTNWELLEIINNKKLLKSTMFYENGGEISANTVVNRLKEGTKSAKSN